MDDTKTCKWDDAVGAELLKHGIDSNNPKPTDKKPDDFKMPHTPCMCPACQDNVAQVIDSTLKMAGITHVALQQNPASQVMAFQLIAASTLKVLQEKATKEEMEFFNENLELLKDKMLTKLEIQLGMESQSNEPEGTGKIFRFPAPGPKMEA